MARILAIDDEPEILLLLQNALGKDGHDVVTRSDPSGIKEEELEWYDLILLDIMMPGINGFELCRKIRDMVDCPILFLTARTLENDITFGFSLGADDYIKKPFDLEELDLRIKNIQKRFNLINEQAIIIDSHLSLMASKNRLYVNEVPYTLTRKECKILLYLSKQKSKVVSSEELMQNLWDYDEMPSEATIRVYIKNLRNIIGKDKIQTVRGNGYIFE